MRAVTMDGAGGPEDNHWIQITSPEATGVQEWTQRAGANVWMSVILFPQQKHYKALLRVNGKYRPLTPGKPAKRHKTFEDANLEAQRFRNKYVPPAYANLPYGG